MLIAISTAGYERGKSVAWEWWQDAEKVQADPASNPTFFGRIYAAPEGADYFDPKVWHQANPSLGVTVPLDSFAADAAEARGNGSKLSAWLRYRLNVWSTPDARFFTPDAWSACAAPPAEPLEGRECYGGIDLASTRDLTAVAWCFPNEDGTYDLDCKFFVPEETAAERSLKDRAPYLDWIRDGWLIATPGSRCDYGVVEQYILEYAERHRVRQIAFDDYNFSSMYNRLTNEGLDCKAFSQKLGFMSSPTKLLDTLVSKQQIRHAGHPVLAWCAGNMAVRSDANGNIAPCKVKSTEKIDGVVASIMALALASTGKPANTSWELIGL
jgi:phage terminase large subunit-like protein